MHSKQSYCCKGGRTLTQGTTWPSTLSQLPPFENMFSPRLPLRFFHPPIVPVVLHLHGEQAQLADGEQGGKLPQGGRHAEAEAAEEAARRDGRRAQRQRVPDAGAPSGPAQCRRTPAVGCGIILVYSF